MDKETKEKIKRLKKEKKYDDIYYNYGSKAYVKNTPARIKRQEKNKLFSEGKYMDIYNKYVYNQKGNKDYNKILVKAMYNEIKENSNFAKAFLWNIKQKIKNVLSVGACVLAIAPPTAAVMINEISREEKEENSVKYEQQIEEYNEKIKNYAQEVNSMNLNDVQIYMKVMDDMWAGIQGYGTPKMDIFGYMELDLANEDGYGVCRNMANDIARKLNEINPQYNARTMAVELGDKGNYTIANIERKFVETNPDNTYVEDNENKQENQDEKHKEGLINWDELIAKGFGNHMVTFVDSQEDNLIIVLDPTNPGIGIYKDGQIIMMNNDRENGAKIESKEVSTTIMTKYGIEGVAEIVKDYGKSFEKCELSEKEIYEKYGIEAQNQSLDFVRSIENKDTFKNSLVVDENSKKNEDYNISFSKEINIENISKKNQNQEQER